MVLFAATTPRVHGSDTVTTREGYGIGMMLRMTSSITILVRKRTLYLDLLDFQPHPSAAACARTEHMQMASILIDSTNTEGLRSSRVEASKPQRGSGCAACRALLL